jgi:hypothetical protein
MKPVPGCGTDGYRTGRKLRSLRKTATALGKTVKVLGLRKEEAGRSASSWLDNLVRGVLLVLYHDVLRNREYAWNAVRFDVGDVLVHLAGCDSLQSDMPVLHDNVNGRHWLQAVAK